MKKLMMPVLSLSVLLAACGQDSPSVTPPVTSTTPPVTSTPPTLKSSDEIPAIPRVITPESYNCSALGASQSLPLSVRLNKGTDIFDQGTRVPGRMTAQSTDLPETLQDLLYTSKSIINNMYYGYSDVDLDTVHENAYLDFKKDFPDKLNSYVLSDYMSLYSNLSDKQQDLVDTKMATYIDNVKDDHTFYMNPAQTDADKNGSAPTPVLGVNLALIPKQDGLVLTAVRLDGPAWTAGLRRGDAILSVNGTPLTRTAGLSDDDQYAAFRKVISAATASGKDMVMTVMRAGKTFEVRATPAVLTGTSMPWGEVRTDSTGKQHYYLRIPTFSSVKPQRTTDVPMPIASRVNQLIAEAQSKGVDNIVVDLRGNGGGLLIEFVGAVAGFAPNIAGESTRYIDGSSLDFAYANGNVTLQDGCKLFGAQYAVQNPIKWNGKVVVLVDDSSASASEMFSTNMRAAGFKIIGDKTYGVGGTSTYHLDLPGYRSMSITAGRTYINGQPVADSVTPDIRSKDDYAKLVNTGVDNTLEVAYAELNK